MMTCTTTDENPGKPLATAWITGASSGIGAALAARMADSGGWRVCLSARRRDRLEALANTRPARLEAWPLDVTDARAVGVTVAAIEKACGPIECAFLNAGDYRPMPATEFDTDLFRRLMEVNYLGVVNAIGALLPGMLARGRGQVLINASVAGWRGLPLAGPYGATKAALINLAETLHAELGPRGVRIRVVNPGFVRTPLTERNDFPMPAMVSVEQAADAILRGLRGSGFEITFPRRFTWVMKLLRVLPYALYFPLVRRMTGR